MRNAPEEMPRRQDDGDRLRDAVLRPASGLQASFQRAGTVAGASYSLIGAIVLLGGLGYVGDEWLGTGPWLLLGGLMLGIVVGFYELARVIWRRSP
jgi:F0F1-type ATP synthase assembly protein I